MKWTYLLIDLFTVIVPFIFSFHPKLNFYKEWKAFFPANSIVAILFIAWDIQFTNRGVWGFNPDYVSGLYFFNLPIEELLFFICIPYACVFTYHCLKLFFDIRWRDLNENIFIIFLSLSLLLIGIIFRDRIYTATTFASLAILLLVFKYFLKVQWIGSLLTIYPVLLIPFFVVNGLLTGYGMKEPVVWYNDGYNLQLRLITIPIEDIFYGFELILLNVFFYELFKKKNSKVSNSVILQS